MAPATTPSRITTLLLAVVATAMPSPALTQHHPSKRDTRDAIAAMERQWRTAELTGDAAAMDKLLSDDYLGITGNGQVVTKLQQLDHMRTRTLAIDQLDITDVKIKRLGNVAIVTSQAQIDGTSEGQPLHGRFRSTRVYQRLPGGLW
ncbi:MAG: nuclear transport factor 2 family protein, partial [Acidobacteriota bacterium]